MVSTVIDPLQLAYRRDIRVDNMVIYLLQQLEIINSETYVVRRLWHLQQHLALSSAGMTTGCMDD